MFPGPPGHPEESNAVFTSGSKNCARDSVGAVKVTLIQASSECGSLSLSPYSEELTIDAPRKKVLARLWVVSQLNRLFMVQGLTIWT